MEQNTTYIECKICRWRFEVLSKPETGICQYCEVFKTLNGEYPAFAHFQGQIAKDIPLDEFDESVKYIGKYLRSLRRKRKGEE